jgi:hypothetical protein
LGSDEIARLPSLSERRRGIEPDLSILVSTDEGVRSLASTAFDVLVIFLPSMLHVTAAETTLDDSFPSNSILIERPENVVRRFAEQWDLQCKGVWSGV